MNLAEKSEESNTLDYLKVIEIAFYLYWISIFVTGIYVLFMPWLKMARTHINPTTSSVIVAVIVFAVVGNVLPEDVSYLKAIEVLFYLYWTSIFIVGTYILSMPWQSLTSQIQNFPPVWLLVIIGAIIIIAQ